MSIALESEPWNWDLWNTPQELDDDDASLELLRQELEEALEGGMKAKRSLRKSSPNPIFNPINQQLGAPQTDTHGPFGPLNIIWV